MLKERKGNFKSKKSFLSHFEKFNILNVKEEFYNHSFNFIFSNAQKSDTLKARNYYNWF